MTASTVGHRGPRQVALFVAGALLLLAFVGLGTWQVERRAWKLDLIARVDERIHAPAEIAPGRDRWAQVSAAADEYRHVSATGVFLADADTLVQAVTELGPGFWVMTPLRRADGSVVLINRGFVPEAPRKTAARRDEARPVTVDGLLRITEPGGAFLRRNDAAARRWYSRDVGAIGAALGLSPVAPYFVDAAAPGVSLDGDTPVGGLTVVAFHNSHLVYAITWYTLALLVVLAGWQVIREERRRTVSRRAGERARSAGGG